MMTSLRRQIKQREAEIVASKIILAQEEILLRQQLSEPFVLSMLMLTSFSAGFLAEYYFVGRKTRRLIAKILGYAKELYKDAKAVLTIITI
jgi:hypothetical protein